MKKFEVTWFGGEDDVKFFRTKDSRISLVEFNKADLKEAKEIFNDVKFTSGVYILEAEIDDNMGLYVGESDDIWSRIKHHIDGKSQLANNKKLVKAENIKRIMLILSSDTFDEFTKSEIHFFEHQLIKEIKMFSNRILLINNDYGHNKNINITSRKLLEQELESIKKALYFVGKDYFKSTFEEGTNDVDDTRVVSLTDKDWIKIFPITNKKRNVKATGNFEFNNILKVIKVYENTHFTGKVDGSTTNFDIMNRYLSRGIENKNLKGTFNVETGEYDIKVIKTHLMKPSSVGIYTRGGVNQGWSFWKDENGQYIETYRNN